MSKTAIFFSPVGGNVNRVAKMLGDLIGDDKVDIIPVKEATEEDVNKYDKIILAGSTVGTDHWDNEAVPDEWPGFFAMIKDFTLEKKKLAIVGLGNSFIYPSHFADGMAFLYDNLKKLNAEIFGEVGPEGYDFTESESINDDGLFCGLPIDEDNEPELTNERLENWISILEPDFKF